MQDFIYNAAKICFPMLIGFSFPTALKMIKQKGEEYYKFRRWPTLTIAIIAGICISVVIICFFALFIDTKALPQTTDINNLSRMNTVERHCTFLSYYDYHNWFSWIFYLFFNIIGVVFGRVIAPKNVVCSEDIGTEGTVFQKEEQLKHAGYDKAKNVNISYISSNIKPPKYTSNIIMSNAGIQKLLSEIAGDLINDQVLLNFANADGRLEKIKETAVENQVLATQQFKQLIREFKDSK